MSHADSLQQVSWQSRMCRMLVVDDDESLVDTIRQLMLTSKCKVDWARDDNLALAMIHEESADLRYDVIIVDLGQVLKPDSALVQLLKGEEPPLTFIGICPLGYDVGPSLLKARNLGMSEFLFKPFQSARFSEVIARILTS